MLRQIGNTPLVELERINPSPNVRLLAKLERNNPGGSVKDRVALSMIESAEASGALTLDKTIIEATEQPRHEEVERQIAPRVAGLGSAAGGRDVLDTGNGEPAILMHFAGKRMQVRRYLSLGEGRRVAQQVVKLLQGRRRQVQRLEQLSERLVRSIVVQAEVPDDGIERTDGINEEDGSGLFPHPGELQEDPDEVCSGLSASVR